MKKSTKLGIVFAVAVIGWGVVKEALTHDAGQMERLNREAGVASAECQETDADGATWMVCRYGGGNFNAWQQRGDEWIAANGKAMSIVDRLQAVDPATVAKLPRVRIDRDDPPPSLPKAIL